jgi:transposase
MIKKYEFELDQALICMEHTGSYNQPLLATLISISSKANIWLETAIQIKSSLGVLRGKNDKIDSGRIATYAFRNQDKVRLWQPPRPVLQKLKALSTLRTRLLRVKNQLQVPVNEVNGFMDKAIIKDLKRFCNESINAVKRAIKKVESEIKTLIQLDEQLKKRFAQITSVQGVGDVTATQVLITTNEFKNINVAKKFACYCGVAPFPHRSGTSIRGKDRVSHLANKKMKTLLHMGAVSAIQVQGDLQDYYNRKLKEGKHIMVILNAIRNKIILRIFAVVQEDREYEKSYQHCLLNP